MIAGKVSAETNLIDILTNLVKQIKSVSGLLVTISYIAGITFFISGMIQFKAHKDTPTQIPLNKPIVYLVVGACLIFLPTVMDASGKTIFLSKYKQSAGLASSRTNF